MIFTSLTQRFAVWFVLVALLPIALIGYGLLHIFEGEIQKSAIQQIAAIADKKAEQIDVFLRERVLDATLIQASDTTHQAIGELTAVFDRSGVDSDAYRELDARYRGHYARFLQGTGYSDLFLIASDGRVVFSILHESDFAVDLLSAPWQTSGLSQIFRRVRETQQSSLSSFELYFPSQHVITAFVAVPILIQGDLHGVLALQIRSEPFFSVLTNNVGLGESGETIVTRLQDAHSAQVIAPLRSNPDAALKQNIALDNTPASQAIRDSLHGESGAGIVTDYRGQSVVAAWRNLPDMDWGMVVQIDFDEAFASIIQMRFAGLVVLGLTLLLAALGALLFNRRVVMPLKNINECAQVVAGGDLRHHIPEKGWDEIGQLAQAFNRMIERLEISYRHLEARVADRTARLEQLNAELAIKEEETRSVVEHLVDCVVTTDERGVMLSVNPVMEKLFGYTVEEAIGQNVSILVPEPDRSRHEYYMQRYCETGYGQQYVGRELQSGGHHVGRGREVEGVHKNGTIIPVYLAVSEYWVGDKRHFTGIMRDLRKQVAIRQDLEQARHDAEQANRAKSIFLAAMSHEIRTPMNGVIGMIDVLSQTGLSSYQKEMVDLVRESAFALLEIIEDILDFSKIEAGRLELERLPLSLEAAVERSCATLTHLAAEKGVELTLFVDPALPAQVLGDALRLRQILINLINNAIKFSAKPDCSGRVMVKTSQVGTVNEDVVTVVFQVVDNGIGMTKEVRERLFTPFSQGDLSTTRRFGGTGLGLTISRYLIQQMGGTIEVESAPDTGAAFSVRIPFHVHSSATEVKSQQEVDLSGLSCVVTGDEAGLAPSLLAYLQYADAAVEYVPDITAVRNRVNSLPTGQWLLVADVGDEDFPVAELRTLFSSRKEADTDDRLLFVIVRRGRRHRSRMEEAGVVTLDGNVLFRRAFLQAVAVAVGRLSLKEEAMTVSETAGKIVPPSREEALQQGRLILVAEDNEINQKVIRQQLALLGFAADIVANGIEALQKWRSGEYGLILTDLHMPEMDGYQLAQSVRAEEADRKHIPIIALTANALKDEAERCRALGMNDYLTKPVQLEQFESVLEQWLPGTASYVASVESEVEQLATDDVHVAVDVSVLQALVGDDPAVVNEFLQDFMSSAQQIAAQMRKAVAERQPEEVRAVAHKLKSSARSVGALTLGEWCARIEATAKQGNTDELIELSAEFERELANVTQYIKMKLARADRQV